MDYIRWGYIISASGGPLCKCIACAAAKLMCLSDLEYGDMQKYFMDRRNSQSAILEAMKIQNEIAKNNFSKVE